VLFNDYIASAIHEKRNEYVMLMEYCYQEETNVLGIRVTVPICPSQIAHWLASDWKRPYATKGRRLNTWI